MDKFMLKDILERSDLKELIEAYGSLTQTAIEISTVSGETFVQTEDYRQACKAARQCGKSIGIMVEDEMVAVLSVVHKQSAAAGEASEVLSLPTEAGDELLLRTLGLMLTGLAKAGYENTRQKNLIERLQNQETILQKDKELLKNLSERDELTGLDNRRKFENAMDYYGGDKSQIVCMISADANNLKMVNDIFGHKEGDRMLSAIAAKLKELAKDNWIVARCGGDEFHLLLPDVTLMAARDYCHRVSRYCKSDKTLNFPLSVAFGAAEWNAEEESLEECFKRADEQMYRNKKDMKRKENLLDYILEKLYERQYLTKEVVEQTARVAFDFAGYLGFNEAGAENVRLAALYQDIGLIHLPEYFMIKGQSITEQEMAQLRQHVEKGYVMALQFEKTHHIAEYILYSHENWDGHGYPKGISGQTIPLEARMIRLVDNYIYWTTPKTVGTTIPKAEARQRIRERAGSIYDPDMVEWFMEYIKKNDL